MYQYVSSTLIPLLIRPRLAGHKILSYSSLGEVRRASKPRQYECPPVRLLEYLLYQLQIDLPWMIPSFSAILCTILYPNQQVFFTTTLFEVSPTSRRLRQMTSTVRSGGHLASQWFSVPSSGTISYVVWL